MAKKTGRDPRDVQFAQLMAATASDRRPQVRAARAELIRAQKARLEGEAQLREAQAAHDAAWKEFVPRDREMNEAIDALAEDLIAMGFPAKNPFVAFGVPAPAVLKRLPPAQKEEETRKLIVALSGPKPSE